LTLGEVIQIIGLAIILYAGANIDDVFVLVSFFADPKLRTRYVVAGQFVGITTLFLASAVASLLSFVIPPPYLGLLGFAPIAVGAWKLRRLCAGTDEQLDAERSGNDRKANALGETLAVTVVTLANCSDNLGIWTPVLAVHSPAQVILIGGVFSAMTALWCFSAFWLVRHPTLGAPLRRYARFIVPFVLIGLGFFVLYHAGSFRLVR
jgi:cadmium resistance protein CadD (predicted permease)